MPHDERKSDMWYHDTMGQFCFMILTPNLAIHMLERPDKYSKEDVIDTLRGIKKHYDAGQAMVYEQYLEMRRLEDADKRP